MTRISLPLMALLPLASLLACTQQAPTPAPAVPTAAASTSGAHGDGSGIAWYAGDVDSAFKTAAAEKKPVLLYWGASWCPPCHLLKATVFSRADFIEKSKLFVPVYLDGDDPGAQKWGEVFKVTGYPTLVVLSADRQEIMRIAGGMDLTLYATVLDNALADVQPVEAVLAASAKRALNESECRRLAFNAWALEETSKDQSAVRQAALQRAAQQCPATLANERLRLAVVAAYYAEQAGKGVPRTLITPVEQLLSDTAMAADNYDVLTLLGDDFFKVVGAPGSAPALAMNARYAAAMDAAAIHPRYTDADHLYAAANKLAAGKALTGKIDPALATSSRHALDTALARKVSPYERSSILNAAMPMFDMLGANAEAYTLLQAELSSAVAPYYYQADLAALAEELGKKDEAIAWSEKAYAGSRGAATRFQWGRLYLNTLLRLKSDDTTLIRATGIKVLAELDGNDRIYRRASQRLAALDGDLKKWAAGNSAQRTPVLRDLRLRMSDTCAKIPANEPARASCSAFLATGL
jgi:thiol-disulfide isomerase/thioredoxin